MKNNARWAIYHFFHNPCIYQNSEKFDQIFLVILVIIWSFLYINHVLNVTKVCIVSFSQLKYGNNSNNTQTRNPDMTFDCNSKVMKQFPFDLAFNNELFIGKVSHQMYHASLLTDDENFEQIFKSQSYFQLFWSSTGINVCPL